MRYNVQMYLSIKGKQDCRTQSFNQRPDEIHLNETFAPVVRLSCIRLLDGPGLELEMITKFRVLIGRVK